jgi:tripartite-type tricarboxylate transporter receptor subunit TctC
MVTPDRSPRLAAGAVAAGMAVIAFSAMAQEYPTRAIRMVVPFPPGAGTDILARAIGQKLTEYWGQSVVVENRPGAGGTVGSELVAKGPRDGYLLLLGNVSTFAIAMSLYRNIGYDSLRDFAPVSLVSSSENVIVLHPSVPARTVQELIALARAKPKQLLYSSAGNGTTGHLAGELFKSMAKVEIVHIPYKGSPLAMNDLLAGQVHMSFTSLASAVPQIKSGRLRAIATTGLKRNSLFDGMPTLDESGLKGYEVNAWQGIVAPTGAPGAIIAKLNGGIARALDAADVKERLGAIGLIAGASTPERFTEYLRAEIGKWRNVVKTAGATVD